MEWLKKASSVELNEGHTEVTAEVSRLGEIVITLQVRDGSRADASGKSSPHSYEPEQNVLSLSFGSEDLIELQYLLREALERSDEAKGLGITAPSKKSLELGTSLH